MDLSQWLVTRRLMWRTDQYHDDVIKWKHFLRYWPFVHKGHWRGASMFSLIWAWINDWVNSREAGDLRRRRAHCDVILMILRWLHGLRGCHKWRIPALTKHGFREDEMINTWIVIEAVIYHWNNVMMSAMASQITNVSIVYSTVCSGTD